MRIFKRIKKTSSDGHFLVLDIGTDNVQALVCEAAGAKARVLGVGKKKQSIGTMRGGSLTDIAAIILNCNAAIREAENMCGISPTKMIMGVSGEIVKGGTNTTSYIRRDSKAKIDLAELKNIVHKIQWKAYDEIRSQLAKESGYSEVDIRLVNAAIVDVRIDGYKVSNPIGFQGKEVTLSVFNAFAPLVHYGALQTIAAEIDKELISIAAESYALTRSIDAGERRVNSIFMDIGAGTTDMAVVRDGKLDGTKMFGLGGNTFTKRLSLNLNVSFEEAEEIKMSYSEDKLERQSHKIVRESMQEDLDVWLAGVLLTLEDFGLEDLPSKILIAGGASNLPEMKEALEGREWHKSLPFEQKPQVSFLNPKMISNISDETRLLKSPSDAVSLSLANLALNFMGEEVVVSKVLKKVVRLMQM